MLIFSLIDCCVSTIDLACRWKTNRGLAKLLMIFYLLIGTRSCDWNNTCILLFHLTKTVKKIFGASKMRIVVVPTIIV